jgi:AcrR family transcriptional regulator
VAEAKSSVASASEEPAAGRELRTQGRRTRKRLLDAATVVLSDKGYHATRVDDIVRRARTSHGTFYLYFANKEDLFRALAVQCADEMTALAADLGPVPSGPEGVEELRSWLRRFLASYRRYGPVIRAWMEDQAIDRSLRRLGRRAFADISGSLVQRVAEGRAPRPSGPELTAAALLAMIERFAYFVTSRELELDEEVLLTTLSTVIHRGFFADGARSGAPTRSTRARS